MELDLARSKAYFYGYLNWTAGDTQNTDLLGCNTWEGGERQHKSTRYFSSVRGLPYDSAGLDFGTCRRRYLRVCRGRQAGAGAGRALQGKQTPRKEKTSYAHQSLHSRQKCTDFTHHARFF